jgi:nucleoside-triphosphatase THEP1
MGGYSFVITGQKNAGKSTLCWQVLKYLNKTQVSTSGVITLQNDKKWFYLITEKTKIPFEAEETEAFIPIGQFRIHRNNLKRVVNSIQTGLDQDFLFVDEIGLLELRGSGYFPILNAVLTREQGNILVVKESLLDDFFSQYPQAKAYTIIQVKNHEITSPLNIIEKHINQQLKT